MNALIIVILLIFVGSLITFGIGIIQYKLYIRKMAKRYTYQEINEKIKKDLEELTNAKYRGAMLESVLDHKELWEQIKEYKRTHF